MSHDQASSRESTRAEAKEAASRVSPAQRVEPPREPIGQWMGHAANIGALVGLLLVVVQLQQTRELMRAQIRHELAAGIVDLLQVPAANSQLASVLRRSEHGDSLGPDEAFQFRLRSSALLRYWEDVHYQYRQGLYVEEEFSRQRLAWANFLQRSIASCGIGARCGRCTPRPSPHRSTLSSPPKPAPLHSAFSLGTRSTDVHQLRQRAEVTHSGVRRTRRPARRRFQLGSISTERAAA